MALDNENGGLQATLPLAPAGNYGYGFPVTGGFGNGFGGDWSWILLLLLITNGGFGGWGMGGMMGMGMMDGFGLYPWMNQAEITTQGFQNQGVQTALSGLQSAVTSGFGDTQLGIAGINQNISTTGAGIQNSLCNGFASVNAAVNNTAAQAEISANGRHSALTAQLFNNEINSLNRSFAEQTANTQGFNNLQGQLAQCCCDNRLATVQTQGVVQSEAAATRAANAANTQAILDKLCALELDGVKSDLAAAQRENLALQNQLNMAAARADNVAQTSRLLADNAAQTQAVENYIRPQINPAYIVPNPFAYNYTPVNGWGNGCCNTGCGCGQ